MPGGETGAFVSPQRLDCAPWVHKAAAISHPHLVAVLAASPVHEPLSPKMRWAHYKRLNISSSVAETAWAVLAETVPSFRTRRCRSTARSWSRATCPRFPWKRTGTLTGYGRVTVVIGATMTVCRCWFISSGEMIKQGRVFWISTPWVGSNVTSQTSSRRGGRSTTAIPCDRTHSVLRSPKGVRRVPPGQPRGMLPPNLGAAGVPEK